MCHTILRGSEMDWNLVIQSYQSFLWIQETVKEENRNKKIDTLLEEFHSKNGGISPFNKGTLISAAFLCFVYPQQSMFDIFDFTSLDISKFSLKTGNCLNAKDLCCRIRNSLTHARFKISNGSLFFEDRKKNGSDRFEAQISLEDFGEFINCFMFMTKKRYFEECNISENNKRVF